MKYLGSISDATSLVPKNYVDNISSGGGDSSSMLEDLSSLLSKVNGAMNDDPFVIPNRTIAHGIIEARAGVSTPSVDTDSLKVSDSIRADKKIEVGGASIIWDEEKGKAVFEDLDVPAGAKSLDELADVSLNSPLVDGQGLVYDYASGKSINKNVQGTGGGALLESWNSYVKGGMSGYGLSADLGYELHSQVDGLDGLLDEINGTPITMIDSINGEII